MHTIRGWEKGNITKKARLERASQRFNFPLAAGQSLRTTYDFKNFIRNGGLATPVVL
jgi:L-alanine-DL-glutamate epimerase-like enolase superfamily enzyme